MAVKRLKRRTGPELPVPMPDVCQSCPKRPVCASNGDYKCQRWEKVFAYYWNHTVECIKKMIEPKEE